MEYTYKEVYKGYMVLLGNIFVCFTWNINDKLVDSFIEKRGYTSRLDYYYINKKKGVLIIEDTN